MTHRAVPLVPDDVTRPQLYVALVAETAPFLCRHPTHTHQVLPTRMSNLPCTLHRPHAVYARSGCSPNAVSVLASSPSSFASSCGCSSISMGTWTPMAASSSSSCSSSLLRFSSFSSIALIDFFRHCNPSNAGRKVGGVEKRRVKTLKWTMKSF